MPKISSPTISSAIWAAWGDAAGFPAELASPSLLQSRLGSNGSAPSTWPRRIGGRMGPTVELPAGCTSDDTQLRLAVGRCIRASGRFDVEAFSKIELPVFLSYELGAGVGTKAAARALARRSTRWYSNFFDTKYSRYVNGGGNGAAMRIQPHVWAAPPGKSETYLPMVIRDAICTHGHPRGLLGAAFHAVALGTTLRFGEIPGPNKWQAMVSHLAIVTDIVQQDEILAERWLPVWEEQAREGIKEALAKTVAELEKLVETAIEASRHVEREDSDARIYEQLVRALGGFDRKTRGSGTISSVLGLWLAWAFADRPDQGVRTAGGLLESDTDTIATMAGAILGVVAPGPPPGPVLDGELIASEAARLELLSQGERSANFPHPDPMHWQAPNSLSDALGLFDGRPSVAGLGPGDLLDKPISGSGEPAGLWQWFLTDFGQHLLVKRRKTLRPLDEGALPRARGAARNGVEHRPVPDPIPDAPPKDPEEAIRSLEGRAFSDEELGRLLRFYCSQDSVRGAVFATLLSQRLRAR